MRAMYDFSCMWVMAVSTHFISPSIISPLNVRYQRAWNFPRYGLFLRVDLGEPLDVGDAVPSGHEQAQREPLVPRQRLAVQRVDQHRLGRQRLLAVQRAAELLLTLNFCVRHSTSSSPRSAPKKTNSRACAFTPALSSTVAQRHARPSPVARQPLQRTSVARALEAGDQFRAAHLAQVVERQRQRPVDESRDLQLEGRQVHHRMAVMLRGEELILRRDRAVDGANVDDPPIGRRVGDDAVRKIEKRHDRLALCERRQHPFRDADQTESRKRQCSFEHVAAGAPGNHHRLSALSWALS